ncbi:PREDICTED: putative disease resistance protein RGA3 [Prunus mume]|uniref:Disease resistance protein RGA3 n=1 Tax=Prunus mume TaxID=102107 RepID=A0ABM0NRD6_PRUMU|nr:PREDICTED: putative disease resistance protein RGA3 [Prunus mume]
MADALVYVVLQQLASTTYQQIEKEVELVLDVKKEVAKITSNLKAIQAVLDDAEKRQVKEAVVRDWLDKLTDVSYEMDDVLDEWNTKILMQQVDNQEKGGDITLLVTKKKVCLFIPFDCFCFGLVSRVIRCRDIKLKLKDLNKKLTEIAEERKAYKFQHTEGRVEQPERQKSSSFVDISKTFGRENEKDIIVSKLLSESSQEIIRGPLVIPIVGMGGMGKTTLAQLAYNDENVKAHFERRIWVCVSDPFDEIKIAKAIIDGNGTPNSDELEAFFQCMSKSIEGKKFLLVLDDVWTQDHRKWEQLKLPLLKGAMGSRILVTTRKEEVAIMMGAKMSHMIHLKQLSEESCWSLFYHLAFFDKEEDESNVFEAIGKEIVKKCKGLPLAAKALGSLMRFKKTKKEWQDVLHSEIWELKEVEQEVFQPLLLSYYDLASAVKRCLLYCVIFPKDYEFNKDNLIELWMSQDYLSLERNQEKEIVGENCFNNLVMRSWFQDFKKDDDGNTTVKMHDIVHDFVQFLNRKECYIMNFKDANKRIELPSDKVRHLTLILASDNQIACSISLSPPVSFDNCKVLRTLSCFDSRITTLDPDLILQLKGLRTLNLSGNIFSELPKEIGKLIHLRYIDLSGNHRMNELPNTVCNLYNLQTLRLTGCRHLAKLPKAIGKVINLKHLHIKCCNALKYLPKGIGRLRSLQVLDGFSVCAADNSETLQLGDLGILDKLQGSLFIKGLGNVRDASEAEKAQLANKRHILHLELDFSNGDKRRQGERDGEMLSFLEPPQSLEFLSISCYCGGSFSSPNWMISLPNLRTLVLRSWKNCDFLPPLGKLPSLQTLSIDDMPSVRKVGVEFLGIEETSALLKSSSPTVSFPKLKKLSFSGMCSWEEWGGVGGLAEEDSEVRIMPCLSSLDILKADSLRTLPDFLRKTPLRDLTIYKCSIFLERGCQESRGEERLKICHIPNIEINYKSVREDGVWIQQEDETEETDSSESDEDDDGIAQE